MDKQTSGTYDDVVVGAGPNGLSAAVTLAGAGRRVLLVEASNAVGGGASSSALTRPGFVHDVGSSIHPMGIGSPFFRQLPLEDYGLEWVHPDAPLAHPLADGRAAVMYRSLQDTAAALDDDGPAYIRLMKPLVDHWEIILDEVLQPFLHIPQHPIHLARFGLRALSPATWLVRQYFRSEEARALFAGIAAHATVPLSAPGSSAIGVMLGMLGHTVGWPFPRGGAQALSDALAAYLHDLGGEVITGWRVASIDELPPASNVVLNVTPRQVLDLAGQRLPLSYRERLKRYRYGPAAFKVDYALSEPIPWTAAACHGAGTIHVGGTMDEIAAAESASAQGKIPEAPFILLAQHTLFDPTRAPDGQHTAWAYCHVPHACDVDMTDRMEAQIERYAPGFRDVVLERCVLSPTALEQINPNLVGGDINGGANTLTQLVARPVLSSTPYRLPSPGLYLCSASTPPGGGVHGMCGYRAAQALLEDDRR